MGVREGCTMSPWLFNLVMDSIVREARESFRGGVQLEETKYLGAMFNVEASCDDEIEN